MAREKKYTYSEPNDTHNAIVSEPVEEYTAGTVDSIVLHVPKGHDVDKLRSKVIAYFNILLADEDNVEAEFYKHLRKWEEETLMYSSIPTIINNKEFQTIVSMGEKAVPFIKRELEKSSSFLYMALERIYKTVLLPPTKEFGFYSFDIKRNSELWLEKLK